MDKQKQYDWADWVMDIEKTTIEKLGLGNVLGNVEVEIVAELGRTMKTVQELRSLGPGDILEMDKLAGKLVDVFINGNLIAKAEVIVIVGEYCEYFGVKIVYLET